MNKLVKDLEIFGAAFGEISSKFILDSGTLLGYVRLGDYLPHDPDLDLSTIDWDAFCEVAKVVRSLPGVGFYHYKGRLYKISIPNRALGTSHYLDIQYFYADSKYYFNYAIGRRGSGNGVYAKGKIRLLRSLLSEMLKKKFDPGYLPFSLLYYHDLWAVPTEYFDNLKEVDGLLVMQPANVDKYLDYRYGNWQEPVEVWVSHKDDGGYKKANE